MQTILVLNPKGGSGKSTISTNLAGFLACWGVQVTIADFDPQCSSLDWLAVRPDAAPKILGLKGEEHPHAIPRQTDYLIMDVPSGAPYESILHWMRLASRILIPVLPSPHDIRATKRFLDHVATDEEAEHETKKIAVIANRVRRNNRSFNQLKSFLESIAFPCVGALRDTQHYVLAAQSGLSIFEMPTKKVSVDIANWQHTVRWICTDKNIYPGTPSL